MSVTVGTILIRKGDAVHSVPPDATIADAARALTEHGIGALVVSRDGRQVDGVISERDIVRTLAEVGAGLLDRPVSDVMTAQVRTCARGDTADELLEVMTEHRIRHLPVVEDGALAGVVSIGDCVKARIDDLEVQAETLQEYVAGNSY